MALGLSTKNSKQTKLLLYLFRIRNNILVKAKFFENIKLWFCEAQANAFVTGKLKSTVIKKCMKCEKRNETLANQI